MHCWESMSPSSSLPPRITQTITPHSVKLHACTAYIPAVCFTLWCCEQRIRFNGVEYSTFIL